jgi:hypothetical protein
MKKAADVSWGKRGKSDEAGFGETDTETEDTEMFDDLKKRIKPRM